MGIHTDSGHVCDSDNIPPLPCQID
ncbi:hypothetical protein A2U01_0060250, partial [Trifolium medium]|nr:hypothetical protein [Trifolium medium]